MPTLDVWIEVDGCGTMPTSLLNIEELLPIVVANSIPSLSQTPVGGLLMLLINAQSFTSVDGSFMVTGKQITWTSSLYTVNPGDTVVAVYSYQG